MKVDINTTFIFKAIGAAISIGTLLWLLAGKFNDAEVERAEIKISLNLLMEERMAKMERTNLYLRFEKTLKSNPSDEDNYSLDRYIDSDYEEQEASKNSEKTKTRISE